MSSGSNVIMARMYKSLLIVATGFLATLASLTQAADGRAVDYQLGKETFEGYWVDAGKNAPVVFMIHDWDGLTDYEKQRAQMLKEQGYSVFAADMFGKGNRPQAIADKKAMTGALYKDRQRMRDIIQAGLKAADAQGSNMDNLTMLGYCFGGTVILEAARAGIEAKGFAGFHAGLGTPKGQDYNEVKGSVILFHGSADRVVSMTEVAKSVEEMEAAGVKHEVDIYSGARHAFSVIGSDRYNKEADTKSWSRYMEFLKEVSL